MALQLGHLKVEAEARLVVEIQRRERVVPGRRKPQKQACDQRCCQDQQREKSGRGLSAASPFSFP